MVKVEVVLRHTSVWALLAIASSAVGCSASPDLQGTSRGVANPSASGTAAAGTVSTTPWSSGASGMQATYVPVAGANANAGSAAGTAGTGGSASDEPLTSSNSCGKGKAEAKLKPVNMFVMFDRSGSMDDDDKWTNASAALTGFFRDPGVAGMRVALRFFPHDSPAAGCSSNGCDAVACSQPLVPLGALSADAAPTDMQEAALVDAVVASAPGGNNRNGGGTPIYAALDGALRWATSYAPMHTDESTVVVFVTDGEPNGCDESFTNISALASQALADSGVTTYAIGLKGSNATQMDQLAQAGGTTKGIYIDVGANAEQDLITALNAIRGQALSCDFPVPTPSDPTMTVDPAKINVTFTPGGGMPGTLAQVPDEGSCGTNKAWFYDMPQMPTRINLCPSACELVRNDPDAMLEILLGCATCGGLDMSCGGSVPPGDIPPVLD